MQGKAAVVLAFALLATPSVSPGADAPVHDWALFKTLSFNGGVSFTPIFGVGGVPVAAGVYANTSNAWLHLYVDRNTYRRERDVITFDMVVQTTKAASRLHRGVQVNCSTRTFLIPTNESYAGPMGTGELKKTVSPYMDKPKTNGDLKADDLAYFCEGPNPAPLGTPPAAPAAEPTRAASDPPGS